MLPAGRKSCAITCATRLSQFLGDERIRDKVGTPSALAMQQMRGLAVHARNGHTCSAPWHSSCVRTNAFDLCANKCTWAGHHPVPSCMHARSAALAAQLTTTACVTERSGIPILFLPAAQGLVCNYVIARNPPSQPTSERAIPVAIFRWAPVWVGGWWVGGVCGGGLPRQSSIGIEYWPPAHGGSVVAILKLPGNGSSLR